MKKYCVFLFNAKTNELSEVLLKGVSKEEAMRKKFNMSFKEKKIRC